MKHAAVTCTAASAAADRAAVRRRQEFWCRLGLEPELRTFGLLEFAEEAG